MDSFDLIFLFTLLYTFFKTCDFLNDVTDGCILVGAMKHFGMTSMDDPPTDNKPPPLTATRAVKKQWLFKVAETIVVNYNVEDVNRFN